MISRPGGRKLERLVEYALILNIDQFMKAIKTGGPNFHLPISGQLHWTFKAGQRSAANFEALLGFPDGYVQLDFLDGRTQGSLEQRISLTTTRPRFGGTRWWFICPVTGERVGRLYLPPGASQFASRRAHGLAYACQTESINERAARRRRKLLARLGDGDAPFGWPPLKPRRMRWATYIRYLSEIKLLEHGAQPPSSWQDS
jgi:hypothetical protein